MLRDGLQLNVLTRTAYLIPCHRKPERCLHINGKPMPLCARCTGILLGYLFVPVLLAIRWQLPILAALLCQLPMMLDGYTQLKKLRTSNNVLRIATGLLSGFGMSSLIISISLLILSICERML